MRLHLLTTCISSLVFSSLMLAAVGGLAHGGEAAKSLEAAPGQGAPARQMKVSALFSTQAQLFVEQKEAPLASKTSLRVTSTPRLSQKSKD